MWSGMAYKHALVPMRKSNRAFDPVWSQWNLAGQLAVGMSDGTFAVWDSMSMEISTSGSSGKHKGPISAGDWFSSLFAPALAFASKNTIKISQGFEGTEWSGTALKLKLGKQASFGPPGSIKDLKDAMTSPGKLARMASASAMAVADKVADKIPDKITSRIPSRLSLGGSSRRNPGCDFGCRSCCRLQCCRGGSRGGSRA